MAHEQLVVTRQVIRDCMNSDDTIMASVSVCGRHAAARPFVPPLGCCNPLEFIYRLD